MNKDSTNSERAQWPEQAWRELRYLRGLSLLVLLMAAGSVVTMFMIGNDIALKVGAGPTAAFIIRNFFVFVGGGIDYLLITALFGVSSPYSTGRSMTILAALALAATLSLSVINNTFIAKKASGNSQLPVLQQELLSRRAQDSLERQQALAIMADAGKEERTRIQAARAQAKQLLDEAIAQGSAHWQKDYQSAKSNMQAWFWTCKKCDRDYRKYRDGIKAAMDQGQQLINDATGYGAMTYAALTPTLSNDLTKDSSLIELKTTILAREEERAQVASLLRWTFLGITFSAAVLAVIVTIVLKEHREKFGSYITETNTDLMLVLFDVFGRGVGLLSDIVYNVVFRGVDYLQGRGVVMAYTFTNNRWSPVEQGNNSQQSANSNSQQQQQQQNNSTQNNSQQRDQQQGQQPVDESANKSPNTSPTEANNSEQQQPQEAAAAAANNTTGANQRIIGDVEELVRVRERCRQRYKRSFNMKSSEDARQRNLDGAQEDAHWLRDRGATVVFNSKEKKAEIQLPKA